MEKIPSVSTPKNIESPQREKIKKLFGHCFEMSRIDEGDRIPVGGKNFLTHEANIYVTGDFENIQPFLTEAHELSGMYDLSKLKQWLESQDIKIDEKLFATLFAFTKKFEETYPKNPGRSEAREKMYKETDTEVLLSSIFKSNVAECAEIAALAQVYLQQAGVLSTYVSGDVLWDKDAEFSEEHSFLIVREGDSVYIYDPTNPTNTTSGIYPSIFATQADFQKEVEQNEKKFVTAQNLLSKHEAYFGVNNGTNVFAEDHIV